MKSNATPTKVASHIRWNLSLQLYPYFFNKKVAVTNEMPLVNGKITLEKVDMKL
jgi:hypothetical protein